MKMEDVSCDIAKTKKMTDEIHLFSLDSVLEDFADDILFNNKHFRHIERSWHCPRNDYTQFCIPANKQKMRAWQGGIS